MTGTVGPTLGVAGPVGVGPLLADGGALDGGWLDDGGVEDGGVDEGGVLLDGGAVDGGLLDGGLLLGGSLDGGVLDGVALLDGGALDGGAVEGGALDGGWLDDGGVDEGGSLLGGFESDGAVDGGSASVGRADGLPPAERAPSTEAACIPPAAVRWDAWSCVAASLALCHSSSTRTAAAPNPAPRHIPLDRPHRLCVADLFVDPAAKCLAARCFRCTCIVRLSDIWSVTN